VKLAKLFSATLILASAQAQQPQTVAHVLDFTGSWRIDGQASPIARKQAIAKGARVIAVSNRPGDVITLIHEQDLSRQQIVCDASPANPCKSPTMVDTPSSPAPPATSQVATLVHAAFAILMGSSPDTASQYAVTMSRSVPSEKIQEAVVTFSPDGTIVLPHSPGGISVGHYTLLITPSGSTTSTTATATLGSGGVWQPMPFAAPGLFRISIRDAQDHHIENLMLLVVNPDHAEALQQAFDQTKTRTDSWTGPNARTDEHQFLRAFLLSARDAQ
jgi:hypothetical protein